MSAVSEGPQGGQCDLSREPWERWSQKRAWVPYWSGQAIQLLWGTAGGALGGF